MWQRTKPNLTIRNAQTWRFSLRADSTVVRKSLIGSAILTVLILCSVSVAVSTGPVAIPVTKTVQAIFAFLTGGEAARVSDTQQAVIEQVRMPRVIMAMSLGSALAVAGAVMQAIFRNPLADPGIIGTSGGGALGAVIMIALGLGGSIFLIPAASVAGATLALLAVFGISFLGGRMSVAALLLAGVAMSSLLGAAVSATILTTDNFTVQREMFFWLAGGFEGATWQSVQIIVPIVLVCTVIVVTRSRDLNLLLIGDDEARSLGISARSFRISMIVLASVLTGIAVAFAGIISFVGLVVPHAVRLIAGPDNRHVVLLSAFGGALFVLIADTIARTIISPAEIRVGIITAMIGGPAFIALLTTTRVNKSSL